MDSIHPLLKMEKKVEIVSSETIKPSCPTPESLRIFKLSLLEQMGINSPYVSIILFYIESQSSSRLKKSLSQSLNHDCMYPLAGRIKDHFSIHCDDQGALFIETRVDDNIPTVIQHPKLDLLRQLLPPDPIATSVNPSERVLLAVQVNHFSCGGTAIGVSISHCIADVSALASFLNNWSALAREETINCDGLIVDCTPIFPPRDFDFLTNHPKKSISQEDATCKTKVVRFVFNASMLASLKQKACKGEFQPTRVEAISAFLWSTVVNGTNRESEKINPLRAHVLCTAINLRKRILLPQLPSHCLGSITHITPTMWTMTDGAEIDVFVGKIRDSLRKVNDDEMKKMHSGDEFFDGFKRACERSSVSTSGGLGLLLTSSWCRFPFYEVDFGWGKPVWVSIGDVLSNNAIFIDASDGEGIETWVRLPKEDVDKLEQDHHFLSHVSSIQSL